MREPLAADEMWCVCHDIWKGMFEWICGYDRAHELLNGGMTKINGRPVTLEVVDEWPGIAGVHIRAAWALGDKPAEVRHNWEIAA